MQQSSHADLPLEQPAVAVAVAASAPAAASAAPLQYVKPFIVPTEKDVICCRRKIKHPGNLFYVDLMKKFKERLAPMVAACEHSNELQLRKLYLAAANRAVQLVCQDRGGRFLKAEDGDLTRCHLMSHQDAIYKAVVAFRRPLRVVKKQATQQLYRIQFTAATPDRIVDPYMFQMIAAVCNHPEANDTNKVETVVQVLDTVVTSPTDAVAARHETMRLQLRHRYLAAARGKLSPIVLSQRLVQFWGGRLYLSTKKAKAAKQKAVAQVPKDHSSAAAAAVPTTATTITTGGAIAAARASNPAPYVPVHGNAPVVESASPSSSKHPVWEKFETINFLIGIEKYGAKRWDLIQPMVPTR